MILVPIDTPGVKIVRSLPVFGWQDQHGHAEIVFDNVRVPVSNLLGEEGGGFAIAQARLGPGRIHHCMRAIGRGRAGPGADGGPGEHADRVRQAARRAGCGVSSRLRCPATRSTRRRLLCEKAAWTIDEHGNKEARNQVAMIKAVAPQMACNVLDRAIQAFGAAGVSNDFGLGYMYKYARTLRIVDGPDEVHRHQLGRQELAKYRPARNHA